MAEAADHWEVDRSTIMRIRTVAKEGALAALAESRPGVQGPRAGLGAGGGPGRRRPARRGAQGDGGQADAGRGKRALGLSGRVPRRVDEATKAALLDLLDRRGRGGLDVAGRVPGARAGRGAGLAVDRAPGRRRARRPSAPAAARCTACSTTRWPRSSALYHEWGEVDRSHRKLAYRGSYLERVWVSPSSVRRVLAAQGLSSAPAAPAGPLGAQAVPGLGRLPAQLDLDLRHDALHQGRRGGDGHRGPGLPQVDRRHRLGRGDLDPGRRSCSPTPSPSRGCWPSSRPARTAASTPPSTTRPADPARRQRQRAADDLGLDPGVHGPVRHRPALRPARHPDRPGVDRVAVRPRQSRVAAPVAIADPAVLRAELAVVRHALQRRPPARRHRLRHPRRRARRTRARDPQGPRGRTRSGPPPTPHLPSPAPT